MTFEAEAAQVKHDGSAGAVQERSLSSSPYLEKICDPVGVRRLL